MSFTQSVRLTVRISAGDFNKEADVALPLSSSLNELMTELVDFIGAPDTDIVWRATTAAGRAVDHVAPLAHTQLADGSLIVLSPAEDLPAPVIRDSAEALVFAASGNSARGILNFWVTAALVVGAGVLGLWISATIAGVITVAACATLIGAVVLGVWHRELSMGWLVMLAGALAAGMGVAGWPMGEISSVRFGFLAAAAGLAVAVLLSHLLGISHPRTAAAGLTVSMLFVIAALSIPGSAGAVLAVAVVLVALAPGLSTLVSGLRVPQLPTAGQDLSLSDDFQPDIDARSARAHNFYEGICIGTALIAAPALGYLAATATLRPIVTLALCLSLAAAVLFHAIRHRQHHALWALMLIAVVATLCAPGAVAVTAAHPPVHPVLWVVSVIPLLAALCSPWWAPLLARATPTFIVWCERLEAVALVVCLPLAAHLAGLFDAIRGLG